MKSRTNFFTTSAIVSYAIKLLIDAVMYLYSQLNLGHLYFDDWYLYIPHIISTIIMMVYYGYYFTNSFEGFVIKGMAGLLMFGNLAFIILLTIDRSVGYVFYFSMIAAMNFFNGLFLKTNIIPERKPGTTGYAPMIFEVTTFVAMAISLYSLFCSFPLSRNNITRQWEYYNIFGGMAVNLVAELILLVQYIICRLHDSEYIEQAKTNYVHHKR